MNLFKRLAALVLAVMLVIGLFPVSAGAAKQTHETLETSFVNPLYADLVPEDVLLPKSHSKPQTYDVHNYTEDLDVAAEALREGMKSRQEAVTIYVFDTEATQESFDALVKEIFAIALEHTGKPTEGDYLRWQWGGIDANADVYGAEDGYNFDITYSFTYYTTAEEEEKVDAEIKKLLDELDLDEKTDYEKIKAVYDYICANVEYDYDHLEDETYTHQFTAYAALMDGTAVCQGYALLLYRLALELDVDARFISGIGNGGPHGWNIIKMDNYYYNADSTWDAGQTTYRYFLKAPANFPDHTREEEFETNEFNRNYPMNSTDYVPNVHTHRYIAVVTDPTCTEQGYTTYTCETCGDILVDDYVDPLGHTEVTDPRVEPTCSKTGLTEGSHCAVCGETIKVQEVIPMIEHTPDDPVRENVIAPSCSAEGSYDEVVYCSVCNRQISRTTFIVEKTEHTSDEPVRENVIAPSCSAEGSYDTVVYCSVCDRQISRTTLTVEKTEHTPCEPVLENVVEPSCTAEGGYDEVVYCDVCDQEISRTTHTVEKKEHTPVTDPRVEPTCSKTGMTEGSHCSVCGEVLLAQEVIPTTEHTPDDPIRENVVDSTCAAEGSYDTVVYCSVCNQEISRTTYTVEKTEHTEVIDPRVEPTCAETGLTEGSHCSVCGEVFVPQEVIPMIDHTPNDPVRENVIEPSCSTEGSYDTVVYCSVCDQEISRTTYTVEKTEHTYQDGVCTVCNGCKVKRIYGEDRIGTALSVAAALKDTLGIEKFDAIILAAGGSGQDQTKFADALSGSYLASTKNAPILLYTKGDLSEANLAFIAENLSEDGTIYLLGGNVSIPAEVEAALVEAGYNTKRLGGDDRYHTNLLILDEAGVEDAEEVLIAGGQAFADSLSASATGLPIMLVKGSKTTLTEAQIEFLKSVESKKITILGGNTAVSAELEAAIEEVVGKDVERVFGETREETSVMIAKKYFPEAEMALITYSKMYPDGLAGGVLANVLGAPLLLTNSGKEDIANAYIEKTGIEAGCVLGGSAVITDETAKAVFGLPENAVIENAYFAG